MHYAWLMHITNRTINTSNNNTDYEKYFGRPSGT